MNAAEQANNEDKLPETPIVNVSEEPLVPAQEFNGPKGLEPTRFGDWERKGRCVDF